MTLPKLIWKTVVSAVVTLAATPAQAQSFRDDFDTVGDPVRWIHQVSPFDQGVSEISNGDLRLTPSPTAAPIPIAGIDADYIELQVLADGRVFQDVSMHTLVHVSGDEPYQVGIQARDTSYLNQSLGVAVWLTLSEDTGGNRRLHLGGANDQGVMSDQNRSTILSAQETDVHLQLDIVGDTAKAFAWAEGQERPERPLLTRRVDESQMGAGNVVLWYGQSRPPGQDLQTASFRFVEVVPEPSSALLASFGLLGLAAWQRRRTA